MFNLAEDVHSLSAFKRNTLDFLTQMKDTGRPLVLTVNGKAELVVQDAANYQKLLERAERTEMLEFLLESRADVEAGRTEPAEEALERLARKHRLKTKKGT